MGGWDYVKSHICVHVKLGSVIVSCFHGKWKLWNEKKESQKLHQNIMELYCEADFSNRKEQFENNLFFQNELLGRTKKHKAETIANGNL